MAVAVDVTGLSRTTIYKLAGTGRLKLKVLNGCVVVDTASVRELVESAEPWSRTSRGNVIQAAARC
jgi:predicted DNA-binding transcriptional regulator AlpA